uniref:MIP25033p n=1 Tax=Drosophila melanogaster TaxID=7227 RepID=E0R929_DROME|nr:MIP25033p [Drosophila melanogaster]
MRMLRLQLMALLLVGLLLALISADPGPQDTEVAREKRGTITLDFGLLLRNLLLKSAQLSSAKANLARTTRRPPTTTTTTPPPPPPPAPIRIRKSGIRSSVPVSCPGPSMWTTLILRHHDLQRLRRPLHSHLDASDRRCDHVHAQRHWHRLLRRTMTTTMTMMRSQRRQLNLHRLHLLRRRPQLRHAQGHGRAHDPSSPILNSGVPPSWATALSINTFFRSRAVAEATAAADPDSGDLVDSQDPDSVADPDAAAFPVTADGPDSQPASPPPSASRFLVNYESDDDFGQPFAGQRAQDAGQDGGQDQGSAGASGIPASSQGYFPPLELGNTNRFPTFNQQQYFYN